MKPIHTEKAPVALGPYSQAVYKNGLLFISGQLGIDPLNNKLGESFTEQARLVFSNLRKILEAADMSFANVIKVTIFLTDLDNFPELNDLYAQCFGEPFPARETVQVSKLPADGAVEISLVAIR